MFFVCDSIFTNGDYSKRCNREMAINTTILYRQCTNKEKKCSTYIFFSKNVQ